MNALATRTHRRRSGVGDSGHHLSGGFTLIELVSVIVIVAIIAGVAMPTMGTLSTSRSYMAATQLFRDITFARQRAMATGVVTWVVISTGAGTWSVMAENPASPGRAGATILNDFATGRPYTITIGGGAGDYPGVTFSSANFGGGTEIGFDWKGKPRINDSTALASQGSVVLGNGSRVTVEVTSGYAKFTP